MVFRIKFKGKSTLMKELQRTIGLWSYNKVFKMNSKSLPEQYKLCSNFYHGDPSDDDSLGFAQQCLQGLPPFAELYTREANNAQGVAPLVMKEMYHCLDVEITVSNVHRDEGITLAVLSSTGLTNQQLIGGRTIYDAAKAVITNARKAMAIVKKSKYEPYIEAGSLPSGEEIEDYYHYVRSEMYKVLVLSRKKGRSESDDNSDGTDNGDETAEDDQSADSKAETMPKNWYFPGFLAFALFGPILPKNQSPQYKAECFLDSDPPSKGKKSNGRAQARKESSELEDRKRSSATVEEGRGISVRDQAVLEQTDIMKALVAQQIRSGAMTDLRDEYNTRRATIERCLLMAVDEEKTYLKFLTAEHFEHPELYTNFLPLQKVLAAGQDIAKYKQQLEDLDTEKKAAYNEAKSNYTGVIDSIVLKTPGNKRHRPSTDNSTGPPASIQVQRQDPHSNLTTPMPALGDGINNVDTGSTEANNDGFETLAKQLNEQLEKDNLGDATSQPV